MKFTGRFCLSFHLWKSSYLVLSIGSCSRELPGFLALFLLLSMAHHSAYWFFFPSHPTVKLSARYWYNLPSQNEYWSPSHFTMLQWAAKLGWKIWFSFEVSNKYPVELKFHYFQAATSSYIVICILRVNKTRQIERFFADAANCSMILQRWVTTDMDSSVYASGG